MADVFSKEDRSGIMRKVKSSGNKSTEIKLIQFFKSHHITGWRRNYKVKGHPDFVFLDRHTAIFVDGCFWHGHNVAEPRMSDGRCLMEDVIESSECCKIPKTNREFWVAKIRRNKERDKEEQRKLAEMGWHCITVWECELKPQKQAATLDSIAYTLNHIWLQDHTARSRKEYSLPEEESMMAAEDG